MSGSEEHNPCRRAMEGAAPQANGRQPRPNAPGAASSSRNHAACRQRSSNKKSHSSQAQQKAIPLHLARLHLSSLSLRERGRASASFAFSMQRPHRGPCASDTKEALCQRNASPSLVLILDPNAQPIKNSPSGFNLMFAECGAIVHPGHAHSNRYEAFTTNEHLTGRSTSDNMQVLAFTAVH